MRPRPYLRELSTPLKAAIGFGVIAAVCWAAAVLLGVIWDKDVDALTWPLFAAMLGTVISAAIELLQTRSRWARGLGGLMIAGVVVLVVGVALIIWYAAAVCGGGGCS